MASNNNRKRPQRGGFTLRIRNPFVREMTDGKDRNESFGVFSTFFRKFTHRTTIDSTKNDYSLFRSAYYSSQIGDAEIDPSFFLGTAFAKPVVNSTMAFAMGAGVTVRINGADDTQPELQAAEDALQTHLDTNYDSIYDWLKFGTRDGDGFYYLDELSNGYNLKPETVDVITEPITGAIVGFNVTEKVQLVDSSTGTKKNYTYLKQYRKSWTRVTRMEANQTQEQGTIVFERVYMRDGTEIDPQSPEYQDDQGNPIKLEVFEDELDERRLPIVHYKNEPEPGSVYGNSELQNILVYMRNYGEILDNATESDIYNGKPVLAMYGVDDPAKDPKNDANTTTEEDGEKTLDWDQRSTLYFKNPQSKAEFLTSPQTMENTGKLLEYYFYNIVEASETPEFVFGTAVSSSKASVSEQMPVVLQKADRKRLQMKKALVDYLKLYISRQIELANPTFFVLAGIEPDIDIEFPTLVDEDKQLTLDTIKFLLESGVIDEVTALKLSAIADRVDDEEEIVRNGLKALQVRNAIAGVLPEETDRLTNELNNNDDLANLGEEE